MKQYLLKYFVLWLGICLATACSEEELPESREGWCNVSLQVTTGAVETKAYGGDTYANAHEFIHSLCLFVVNEQGQIEKKIYPQDLATTHPEAAEGNLLNWSSPNFEIPEGTKTIYAFANWETAGSTEWNAIIAKTDKDQLTEDMLRIAVDLNGKIDLTSETKKFIPMSGKTTVTLAANADRSIPITLTRLVSRVEIRLTNKHTNDLTMSEESMGNFADAVTLFENWGTVSGRNQEIVRTGTISPIAQNGSDSWVFYVNETNGSEPFNIKMTLGGTDYNTPTVRKELPRNSVYHLVFTYSEYQLTLAAKAQIAPIGVLPIEVYPERSLTNEYMLELPEGCTFSIKPSITKNGSPLAGTVSWAWTNNSPSLVAGLGATTPDYTFSGYLTAQTGQDAKLTLVPIASGETGLPEYTITIRPVALPDLQSASLFGLSPWGSRLRSAECFNLIVNGKEDKQ